MKINEKFLTNVIEFLLFFAKKMYFIGKLLSA